MTFHPKGATPIVLIAFAGLATAAAAAADSGTSAAGSDRKQSTALISRAADGSLPNGPSTNAVISGDRRYARVIAFESEASDLVGGDTNGHKDVFAIKRTGRINNMGTPWQGGSAIRVSRTRTGGPANGPSFGAAVSGDFRNPGKCVAFLSAANNLVPGDTNGKVDAFLARSPGRGVSRMSPGGRRQLRADVDSVTVSGDCSRVSYTAAGRLYTKRSGRLARRVRALGSATDPQYATGHSNALVYAARGGVWLSGAGTRRGRLVARGGRNPAFNDLKRRTLVYEKTVGGRVQIAYRDLGRGERIISSRRGDAGNADSREPTIGNSGYYVAFESDASNLGVNATGQTGDRNRRPDAYLFTDVRDITLVQSVREKAVPLPGGGQNPSMAYYANYILFDSPAPLGAANGGHQIYMRYLGGL